MQFQYYLVGISLLNNINNIVKYALKVTISYMVTFRSLFWWIGIQKHWYADRRLGDNKKNLVET